MEIKWEKINYSLTANELKIIAIVAMYFDHFCAVFLDHGTIIGFVSRTPGRIAAPIFCYFISEGYHYTSNREKYISRLLIFAAISHLPFNLAFGHTFFQATSIIWGLAMGFIALAAVKSDKLPLWVKPIVVAACCALAVTANWNYVAVLWIVAFGLFRGDFKKQILAFCAIGIVFHLIPTYLNFGSMHDGYPHWWYQIGIFLAIPLLALYSGKLGRKSKTMSWFFYVFYPGHLLLIYLLYRFTSLSTLFM
jgi:accessory gene regulator protein AgrB